MLEIYTGFHLCFISLHLNLITHVFCYIETTQVKNLSDRERTIIRSHNLLNELYNYTDSNFFYFPALGGILALKSTHRDSKRIKH